MVIGKDTRRSGYMFENALTAGLTDWDGGIVAGSCANTCGWFVNPSMRADFGIMISASHNAYHDNGIKFLAPMDLNYLMRPKKKLNA